MENLIPMLQHQSLTEEDIKRHLEVFSSAIIDLNRDIEQIRATQLKLLELLSKYGDAE